jgi:UDP-galactose transporter
MNASIGLAAAVVACVISGIAGVYFESILKVKEGLKASLWTRSVQMSFYSLWPLLFLGVIFLDGEHIQKIGFFAGYNWAVWMVIFLQAVGGILVALSLSYTDSMSKSSATSVSTVITLVVSALVLEFPATLLVSLALHTNGLIMTDDSIVLTRLADGPRGCVFVSLDT